MMKKILFFTVLLVSAQAAVAEQVTIQTKNTTMVLNVDLATAGWMPILPMA